MADDYTLEHRFDVALRLAQSRCRLQRLARWVPAWAWAGAGVAFLLLVLALVVPELALHAGPVIALFLIAWMVALAVMAMAPLPKARVLAELDRHAGLADGAVSAAAWYRDDPQGWQQVQVRRTVDALDALDWKTQWPVERPRRAFWPFAAVFLAMMGLVLLHEGAVLHWKNAQQLATAEKPDLSDEAAALEEVFKDWDKVNEQQPDPQLKELLEQLEPLREQLAEGKMDERQLFMELNRVQEKLAQMREQLDQQSVEPLADAMAEGMEPLDGAGALAAALRRKDFAAAKDEAQKLQQQYANGQRPMPSGSSADQAGSRLQRVAAQSGQRGNQGLSQSLQRMGQGAQKGDRQQMSQGMQGMTGQLGQEMSRQQQRQGLSLQMAQMNAAKMCLGQNPGQGQQGGMGGALGSMPKLSDKGKDDGKKGSGAGSEAAKDKFADATQLDGQRLATAVSGQPGAAGLSEISIEKSTQLQMESTAAGVTGAEFSAYERLSRQAIEDENLPLAHRQMIKAYFEGIRPADAKSNTNKRPSEK